MINLNMQKWASSSHRLDYVAAPYADGHTRSDTVS